MSFHWKAVAVVTGGILVHITLGNVYTFGNLTPYLTSYLRQRTSDEVLHYGDSVWIVSLTVLCQASSIFLGGLISRKLRSQFTVLLGSWLMSAGVMVTYFTVQHSFISVIFTYGVITGFGTGIAYATPLSCAMKVMFHLTIFDYNYRDISMTIFYALLLRVTFLLRWMPGREGVAGGLVVAAFGAGAFVFNQVQTAFVNPENLAPDLEAEGEIYFSQSEVLDRVPWVFVLCGGIYAVMQLIGVLLISEPALEEITALVMEDNGIINDDVPMSDEVQIDANDKDSETSFYQLQQKAEETDRSTLTEEVHDNFTGLQVLRTRSFYILWFCMMFNCLGVVIVPSLYKAYGQQFIKDDFFLAATGSAASLFNCVGRVVWGSIVDRCSYKMTILCMCASFACLMFTLDVTSFGGKPVFFIYICLLYSVFSGNYILFSVATAKAFGLEHYTVNYGLVFTSQTISSVLGGVVSSQLLEVIGWFGMFTLVGCFSFAGMLLTMIY